jgi:hypothetical protein
MLTEDQQTALLMVMADQRIQIANLTGEVLLLKAALAGATPAQEPTEETPPA